MVMGLKVAGRGRRLAGAWCAVAATVGVARAPSSRSALVLVVRGTASRKGEKVFSKKNVSQNSECDIEYMDDI